MFLRFKNVIIALILLITTFVCVLNIDNSIYSTASVRLVKPLQIILDAGHGGFDGGAVAADGTVEKDINLEICIELKRMLTQSGFEVIMTRETDVSTDSTEISYSKKSDLKNRLNLMKDYPQAIFVSIHLNKFTTATAKGSQVFYSGKSEDSYELGKMIQNSIVEMLQPQNTRVNKEATSSTYILYNATIPAVLVECGFLSNKSDLENLKNPKYQKQMAFCIYRGIMEYYSNNKEI